MFEVNTQELDQLIALLTKIEVSDNKVQREIYEQQQKLESKQEYYIYLVYILVNKDMETALRQSAGLVLKSSLSRARDSV